MGKPVRDLTGQSFGKLAVQIRAGTNKHGSATWQCECECGTVCVVVGRQLVTGKTKSCGCSQGKKPETSYGARRGTKLYETWKSMKARCHNPRNPAFKNYGGRGIEVCKRWRSDFLAFVADMGDPPSDKHTIERVNNDAGYSPDNCTWATRIEQRANQRDTDRKGSANGRAKLTDNDVRAIRLNSLGVTKLSAAYGVSRWTIHAIRTGKVWKHVD